MTTAAVGLAHGLDEREAAVFGVSQSATGRRWQMRPADERQAVALAQRHALSEPVGRALAARHVTVETADQFLSPTLRVSLPDPSSLRDVDIAAERLATAVMQGERIAVFGDYDVDGATASAVLGRFLRSVGVGAVDVYVPDRQREGYGPSPAAMKVLAERGASVVVTVDCGTSAHDALSAAVEAGMEAIIVDHHVAEAKLPPALAVVNPNRLDETTPHRQLAAVGVTFLLTVAANRTLRRAGWYAGRPEPDLRRLLDLVALGTICDAVPLTGVNRALVAQGLKVMAARGNPGLKALSDVSGLREKPGAYHAAFVLGPRINAGGRVGESGLGARLLNSDDEAECAELAARLDAFNRERQRIESTVLAEATAQVAATDDDDGAMPVIVVGSEGWHAGVLGIVASRLTDRFRRPSLVVGWNGDTGTGSGRSVVGADLGAAVIAARQAGLLEKGGGHAMAAGFTVTRSRLQAFKDFLAERLQPAVTVGGGQAVLDVDLALTGVAVTPTLTADIARLAPFGNGNPEPRLVLSDLRVVNATVFGAGHVRCVFGDTAGRRLQGMAFRSADSPLGRALLENAGAPLHVAARLRIEGGRGRNGPEIIIDDVAPWSPAVAN